MIYLDASITKPSVGVVLIALILIWVNTFAGTFVMSHNDVAYFLRMRLA